MTGQSLIVQPGYDKTPEYLRIVDAARHLNGFRTGYGEALEALALRATEYVPDNGKAHLEPMLRSLGVERSGRFAERLYRIASDITAGWQPHVDIDKAVEALHAVIHEATNAVMAELYRDTCVCRDVTR